MGDHRNYDIIQMRTDAPKTLSIPPAGGYGNAFSGKGTSRIEAISVNERWRFQSAPSLHCLVCAPLYDSQSLSAKRRSLPGCCGCKVPALEGENYAIPLSTTYDRQFLEKNDLQIRALRKKQRKHTGLSQILTLKSTFRLVDRTNFSGTQSCAMAGALAGALRNFRQIFNPR